MKRETKDLLRLTALAFAALCLAGILGCAPASQAPMYGDQTLAPPTADARRLAEEQLDDTDVVVVDDPEIVWPEDLTKVFRIVGVRSLGSGWAIDPHHLVTAKHVVQDNPILFIDDVFGNQHLVGEVKTSPELDVAVIEIPDELPIFPLSDTLGMPGDPLVALGWSFGEHAAIGNGYVFGWYRGQMICDVTIFPGFSGGPVLNEDGEVIGISVAGSTDGGTRGVAIMIGIDVVKEDVDALLGGTYERTEDSASRRTNRPGNPRP